MGSFLYFYHELKNAYIRKYPYYQENIDEFIKGEALKLIFEMLIKDDAVGKDLIDMKIKEILK